MNSKNLHKHAVPVVLVGVALLLVVGVLGSQTFNAHNEVATSLLSPVVTLSPKSNGLAEVRLKDGDSNGAVNAVHALDVAVPLSVGLAGN